MFSLERRGSRITLHGPEGRYSIYNPARVFTRMGWDAQAAATLLLGAAPRSVLLLGYGGGTVARQLRLMFPNVRLTGVEIDLQIIELARRYFRAGATGAAIVGGCGERFIRESRRAFDVVLDDMWDHDQRRPRAILADPQWPAAVARRLTARGMYAANVYRHVVTPFEYDSTVDRMRRVFPAVTQVALPHERVCVLVGSLQPARPDCIGRLLSRIHHTARAHLADIEVTAC